MVNCDDDHEMLLKRGLPVFLGGGALPQHNAVKQLARYSQMWCFVDSGAV